MSTETELTYGITKGIKKNFPEAGPPLNQITGNITTTYSATAPYTQTDALGVKSITISPTGVAALTGLSAGIHVCFGAPNDAVAIAWLGDTTANSRVLQWYYVPEGTTETFVFDSAITRWDYVAVVNTCVVNERVSR